MIGRTVSHYRITRKLGAGGIGVVYQAVDTRLDRTVALKFLPLQSTQDPQAKERFVREAKAASALDHHNVCVIHEIDESEEGQLFLAMARYKGETLKDRLTRGPLPVAEAVSIARQIVTGLAEAHARNIVHRDINPANIFLTEEGVVKILDFGLAQLVGETRLTREGAPLGTVHYMAPEQIRGEMADPRTDLWSLGVVLYQMISGLVPFQGDHGQAVIYFILNDDYPPLETVAPGAPGWLVGLVDGCLRKNIEDRPPDAGAVLRALDGSAEEVGDTPSPPRLKTRSRMGFRGILLIVASVVLLGLLGRLFLAGQDRESTWLVLSSLENLTADPGLGPLVEEGLVIGLGQSSHVKLFTGQRLDRALGRMGRLPADTLGLDTACELALREGVPVVLATSIDEAGDGLQLVARIIDPESREVLYTELAEVEDEDQLIGELDKVVKSLRKHLGESSWSISRSSEPLARVTTPSLEALRFYSMGTRETDKERAITLFSQAVATDPDFAMAHARLARVCFYSAATGDALKHSRRAYELRDRLPLREKLYVEGEYHRIRAQFGEAIKSMRTLLELDPDDSECRTNLIHAYLFLIQYRQALDQFHKYDEGTRNLPSGHHLHGILLGGLGRYQEARDQLRLAIAKSEGPSLTSRLVLATAHICDLQVEAALAQLDTMLVLDTDSVIGARYMVGRTLRALGRYEESLGYLSEARNMALAVDDSNRAAWADIFSGLNYSSQGDHAEAARILRRAVAFWPGDVPHYWLGRELGALGDTAGTREVERELARMVASEPTGRSRSDLKKLRGALAYHRGEYEEAIGFLESCPLELDARLLLGQAYVEVGKEAEGRAQYRFIIDNRFHAFMDALVGVWPLAYYNLGVLEHEVGNYPEAREWLTAFTGYWAAGDQDIPELVDAKQRLGLLAEEGP